MHWLFRDVGPFPRLRTDDLLGSKPVDQRMSIYEPLENWIDDKLTAAGWIHHEPRAAMLLDPQHKDVQQAFIDKIKEFATEVKVVSAQALSCLKSLSRDAQPDQSCKSE